MARRVKVSTLGVAALSSGPEGKLFGQEAVERMKSHWKDQLDQVLPDEPDLIVLPEACDRFADHTTEERVHYYRTRKDQIRDFLAGIAKAHRCTIAYPAIREVQTGAWRNSIQLLGPDRDLIGIYNKNHVVIEETTQDGVLCGKEAPIFQCSFGRVACAICFDLDFDALRQQYVQAQPDMILFSSMYHGGLMQRYWAYSCRAHFVGAIAGPPSAIINPVGEILATTTNYSNHVTATINLDCAVCHLDYNWQRLRDMKDKYGPKVKMLDPGFLGSVLISSETEDFTIHDVVKEFEIELLDDYMARALAHHQDPRNIEP